MRRLLTAAVLLAAALGTGAVSAGAHVSPAPARAELTDQICHSALDPAARFLSTTAVMRPLPGTAHMGVRFGLLERPVRGGFRRLTATGLGVWIAPSVPTLGQRPGDVWKIVHPVADLAAPASYRLRVDFRWTGAHGQVLQTVSRTSRTCYQPELRPDLVVRRVAVLPDPQNPQTQDDYLVQVTDTGATGADGVVVRFIDAGSAQERTVGHLGAHRSRTLTFIGSACDSADPPSVTIDPNGLLNVASRAQASRVLRCAVASSTSSGSTPSGG